MPKVNGDSPADTTHGASSFQEKFSSLPSHIQLAPQVVPQGSVLNSIPKAPPLPSGKKPRVPLTALNINLSPGYLGRTRLPRNSELRNQHRSAIEKSNTFKTHGISREIADNYLSQTNGPGSVLLEHVRRAAPTASAEVIYARAVEQICSGSTLPEMRRGSELPRTLLKIVPSGKKVSPYSPYFMTLDEFEKAQRLARESKKTLADILALPLGSETSDYSVFKIDLINENACVFEAQIAKSSELNLVQSPGGVKQCIVPCRSDWTEPVFAGYALNGGAVLLRNSVLG